VDDVGLQPYRAHVFSPPKRPRLWPSVFAVFSALTAGGLAVGLWQFQLPADWREHLPAIPFVVGAAITALSLTFATLAWLLRRRIILGPERLLMIAAVFYGVCAGIPYVIWWLCGVWRLATRDH
jgi:hypothetical protein